MKLLDVGALVLLAGLWGGSFLFMRIAAPALGPLLMADSRVLLAGSSLIAFAAVAGGAPGLAGRWKSFLIVGALNAAIPYSLIGMAELHLTAGLASVLNATTPLFTALVAAVWLKESLKARQVLGLLLGIGGVAVLVGWGPLSLTPLLLGSMAASLAAAISYAFAGVYAKGAFTGLTPLTTATGQQLGAGFLLLPLALTSAAIEPASIHLSLKVAVAMVLLALLCTSIAYLLYFHLITHVGPTGTLSVTFLIPIFGLFWGALFLGEPAGASTLLGLAVILASVLLVLGMRIPIRAPWRRRIATHASQARGLPELGDDVAS